MNTKPPTTEDDRRSAIAVGILFLIALVPFMIGSVLYGPSTGTSDFLESAYPDRATVTLGVLLEFVAVLAIPLIGAFMYPILKRYGQALAMSYFGFRALEGLLLIINQAKVLSLIGLSDEHLNGASTDTSQLQAIGDSLLREKDQVFALYVLVFGLGALVFYALLYYSRLVPRWLAGWGFVAAVWMMVGDLLGMFDVFADAGALVEVIFVIAVPLNEIVLAFWLIFKGFDQTANQVSLDPAVDRASINV